MARASIPARRSIAERSGYWKRLDAEATAAAQAALARPRPPDDPNNLVASALMEALEPVVANQQTPEAALQDAQAALDAQRAQAARTPTPKALPIVVATPVPRNLAAETTTITFEGVHLEAGALQRLASTFNQQQSAVFVQLQDTPLDGSVRFGDMAAKADCFAWPVPPTPAESAAVLDLQPLIDADAAFPRADYPAALFGPLQHDGKLAGLPQEVRLRLLAYSRSIFDASGLARPGAGWALNDLLATAQALTDASATPRRYGFAAPESNDIPFFISRLGASATQGSGEALQPSFTDGRVMRALQAYIDLLRDSSPHKRLQGYTRVSEPDEAAMLVREGQVAMWFSFDLDAIEQSAARTAWAVAAPPLPNGPLGADDFAVSGLFIGARSQKIAACWSWLKALSGDSAALKSGFPARRSLAESSDFERRAPEGAREAYVAYHTAFERTASPAAALDSAPVDFFWLYRAVDRALQGKDLERELQDAQLLTEQYLACVRGGEKPGACARQVDPEYQGRAVP
jgi:ABC-type glycerol-3-phosphate transport system substrate-binding protein